jgi:1-acyl-sn-glycerol-3-phosphate acyltransferase
LFTRQDWRGAEHLPTDTGFVACVNHISYLDPLSVAHFLHDNGYPPRFLAKESLFRIPVGGRIMHGAGQIPVRRGAADAGQALGAAMRAVEQGECVVVYPEATLTRDPDLWPMVGKTGAARIALATGCPVVPIAQWGVQEILAPYASRPRLVPRRTMHVHAGPPLDLDRFRGGPPDAVRLRAVTDLVLASITDLLAGIRGERAPATPWDPRGRSTG